MVVSRGSAWNEEPKIAWELDLRGSSPERERSHRDLPAPRAVHTFSSGLVKEFVANNIRSLSQLLGKVTSDDPYLWNAFWGAYRK